MVAKWAFLMLFSKKMALFQNFFISRNVIKCRKNAILALYYVLKWGLGNPVPAVRADFPRKVVVFTHFQRRTKVFAIVKSYRRLFGYKTATNSY